MRHHPILPALVPVLLLSSAIVTQLPMQAQTVIYHNQTDRDYYRDYYYPHGGHSFPAYPGGQSRYEIEDSTLVNPVIVNPQIRDSTLINPVIVEPGRTYPSRSYPSQSYPSQTVRRGPAASSNPSCVDFASLRLACQQ